MPYLVSTLTSGCQLYSSTPLYLLLYCTRIVIIIIETHYLTLSPSLALSSIIHPRNRHLPQGTTWFLHSCITRDFFFPHYITDLMTRKA